MFTVTRLARACGLSRSTVLYYESAGLLRPPRRSSGNYRTYSERDLERLRQICLWRSMGLKVGDIRVLLERPSGDAAVVLQRRLSEIGAEIERLRSHQRAILQLLNSKPSIWRSKVISKEKWVSIMRAAGMSDDDMHRWHAEFEKAAPAEHQEFLEFLHIPAAEIRSIRDWSRAHGW
jgi:DNA-binding transcriptional MerR regulator